jgi:hypothetical protein
MHCLFMLVYCLFSACSLPIHCLFTAYYCLCVLPVPSLPVHTACSLPVHSLFTADLKASHCLSCLFTACSLPVQCLFSACSLHIHCLFTAYSPVHCLCLFCNTYTMPVPSSISMGLFTVYAIPLQGSTQMHHHCTRHCTRHCTHND